jgi:hypothetical protein
MLSLTADADPAAARLQLFDQDQQFFPSLLREDGAGNIDDVCFEELNQREVFQQKLSTAPGQRGDSLSKMDVGRQEVHADGFSAKA